MNFLSNQTPEVTLRISRTASISQYLIRTNHAITLRLYHPRWHPCQFRHGARLRWLPVRVPLRPLPRGAVLQRQLPLCNCDHCRRTGTYLHMRLSALTIMDVTCGLTSIGNGLTVMVADSGSLAYRFNVEFENPIKTSFHGFQAIVRFS